MVNKKELLYEECYLSKIQMKNKQENNWQNDHDTPNKHFTMMLVMESIGLLEMLLGKKLKEIVAIECT